MCVPGDDQLRRARGGVYVAFGFAGFAFASWASRIPQVRAELRVSPGVLGLILLCIAIGSAVAAATVATVPVAARRFLPPAPARVEPGTTENRPQIREKRHPLAAWTEPRTLLIGVFVACVTIIEGTGNDWLSLGVITGYHAAAAIGTATFALFLAAMTTGRWFGPRLIDRYGRVPVLRPAAGVALAGLLLVGFSGWLPAAILGAVLMGLGTSLGFPVGMSAAGDDPRHAAGRVSVASSIGYVAFLAGPPAIGFIADHAGILHAVTSAGVLLLVAFAAARATAPGRPA